MFVYECRWLAVMPAEPLCGVLRRWQRLLREQGLGMRHATNINVDAATKDPRVWTSAVLAGHVGGAHVGAGGDGHVDVRGATARGAEAGGDGGDAASGGSVSVSGGSSSSDLGGALARWSWGDGWRRDYVRLRECVGQWRVGAVARWGRLCQQW
jgi:hypothetical protein